MYRFNQRRTDSGMTRITIASIKIASITQIPGAFPVDGLPERIQYSATGQSGARSKIMQISWPYRMVYQSLRCESAQMKTIEFGIVRFMALTAMARVL